MNTKGTEYAHPEVLVEGDWLEQHLNDIRRGWGKEWPEGKHLFSLGKTDVIAREELDMVRVARLLGHPVVVTSQGDELHFYGETV